MNIIKQEHLGSVRSLTHATCVVAEPIVVVIEGQVTELSLPDARRLRDGLSAAIDHVQASEKRIVGDGDTYNCACIAKSGSGMSMPRSKLGVGGCVEDFDPVGDSELMSKIFSATRGCDQPQ